MINKYKPVYTCLLCGKIFEVTKDTYELDESALPSMISSIIRQSQFAMTNPYLGGIPLNTTHSCGNGNIGVSNFSGLRKIN